MARTITLTATNDNTKQITLTRDGDSVIIAFNLDIDKEKDLYFTIPTWAQPEEEKYLFSGEIGLLVPAPGKNIYIALNATIRDYFDLTFSVKHSHLYSGTFRYNARSYENGIILDGQRLNCIATIEKITHSVMEDIQRNHQGELIVSKTYDAAYKKTFNITTHPIADIRYLLGGDVYTNTLEEMYKLLYNYNNIAEYRGFHYMGDDYICLLSGDVSETDRFVNLGNQFFTAKIFKFTLEEV